MKLCGKVGTIEMIEKVIKQTNQANLGRGNGTNKIQGGDFRPPVFHRTYWLRLKSHVFAVKVKLAFDYRKYDYKDNVSEIEVRDDRVWLVAAQFPQLAELFCQLTPFYTRSQYYAHKHRGSQTLKAVDRLLE